VKARVAFLAALTLAMLVGRAQEPIAAPVIVVETAHGIFQIETYPKDAPKAVAHIVELVARGFYDGQRVHRALPGFVVQWGDPRSADPLRQEEWGRGDAASSGEPVGAIELSKRLHVKGAVGMSHPGSPSLADSQIYVTLDKRPDLDGRYVVIGRVTEGIEVVDRLRRGDLIVKMSLKTP
jgi:cyclophilin family peptidyl-prolyl cis-trans isomerase